MTNTDKILIKEEWHYKNLPLEQAGNMSDYSAVPDGTKYFYECTYICPTCKRNMNKALIRDNVYIKVNHARVPLSRVFSCPTCHHFITHYKNQPLSAGVYWYLPVTEERYKKLIKILDEFGRYHEESNIGLFDSFYAEGSNTKVFNYIQNMPKAELVSAIKSEYERIKGNCRYTPTMGKSGSFEFAGALLIWKYCRENARANLSVCCGLMTRLGEIIGYAYNGMPAGKWSEIMIDVVINNNDLFDYAEWNQIYNYLEENFTIIHALEFNEGKMSELQRAEVYADFLRTYNSLPDFDAICEYYTKQGLRLESDMPFNSLPDFNAIYDSEYHARYGL